MARHPSQSRTVPGDPDLSPRAAEILTEELREATGRPDVRVRPARAGEDRPDATPPGRRAGANLPLGIGVPVLLLVGGVLWVATGSWWTVAIVVVVLVALMLTVGAGALRLTTSVEHVTPERSAALEEEGVADPDKALGDLVAEVADDSPTHAAGDLATDEDRTAADAADPAQDAVAQSRTWTPSHRSHPLGDGADDDVPDVLEPDDDRDR